MTNKKTTHRGISYPAFIIAVFVALSFAATAIVCVYQLYRSNQANYRAVQQIQASIAQLPAQPQEAPASLSEALSIVQGQFDSYQSSLSLTLAVAGVVFSLFALAVPLMNYFFFQKEQVEKLQAAAAQAEALTAQAEALQEKTVDVTTQLAENQRAAKQLEETQENQQQRFETEIERVKNSTQQMQTVLAAMSDRKFTLSVKPLSSSLQDEVDALYLNALIARSSTQKIRYLQKYLELSPNDYKAYSRLAITYIKEHMFTELLECACNALRLCSDVPDYDRASFIMYEGYAHRNLGDIDKAMSAYREAERLCKETGKTDSSANSWVYFGLGDVYSDAGKQEKALECYEIAKEIRERRLGLDHPDTAMCYTAIGLALIHTGKHNEAFESLDKALMIQFDSSGENILDTAWTYYGLALYWHSQGNESSAAEFAVRAYHIVQYRNSNPMKRKKIVSLLFELHGLQHEISHELADSFDAWLSTMIERYVYHA